MARVILAHWRARIILAVPFVHRSCGLPLFVQVTSAAAPALWGVYA